MVQCITHELAGMQGSRARAIPNERISVSKLKQLIGLQTSNLSVRELARAPGLSIEAVSKYQRVVRAATTAQRGEPEKDCYEANIPNRSLAGVELAHRIRKREPTVGSRGPHQFSSLKHAWALALVSNDNTAAARETSRRPIFDRECTRTHQLVCAC